jgi:eukaryotic-like serine/threonine-protein kinase
MMIRCQRCREQLDITARFCGACGATIADPNIERVIAQRYVLKERIFGGSLGIVYRAEQIGLQRKLAVKLLAAETAADPLLVERFKREGNVLCQLRSAHTVTTYEFDRDRDGTLYIAMELPVGRSLAEILEREGRLEWRRALRVLAGVCDAIGEAHALGVVHRDLRPDNLVLGLAADGREVVKVLDFGLAKLLQADIALSPVGQTVGALEYVSPEQLQSRPIDARTDLYGVGILGYRAITGRHPFAGARSYGDLVAAHINAVPPAPSSLCPELPPEVDFFLGRCLEKDPARRFPDATMLQSLIEIALATQPVI